MSPIVSRAAQGPKAWLMQTINFAPASRLLRRCMKSCAERLRRYTEAAAAAANPTTLLMSSSASWFCYVKPLVTGDIQIYPS